MASVAKFTLHAVINQLRHNERMIQNSSNKDIDTHKSSFNYSLLPDRRMTAYDYFLKRKNELYCYNRSDVKVMVGWIVTAPQTLPPAEHKAFFQTVYNFLSERYGEKNCIQAIVHNDESGQPHLHYCFIPAAPDAKRGGEKICANDIITPKELRNFHPDLQRYLREHDIDADVYTGITSRQGGNKSVRELKRERQYEYDYSYDKGRW